MLSISSNVTLNNLENFIDTLTTCIIDKDMLLQMKERILNNKLPAVIDKTNIGKSKVHGVGVFSKTNIKKGDVVTLYPADIIIKNNGYKIDKSLCDKISNPMVYKQYLTVLNDEYSVIGYPEELNSSYLGHMCNDGAKGHYKLDTISEDVDVEKINKDRKLYEMISKHKMNAEIVFIRDCVIAVIATKDIESGEEIFISYGYERWSMINS